MAVSSYVWAFFPNRTRTNFFKGEKRIKENDERADRIPVAPRTWKPRFHLLRFVYLLIFLVNPKASENVFDLLSSLRPKVQKCRWVRLRFAVREERREVKGQMTQSSDRVLPTHFSLFISLELFYSTSPCFN